jgi:hypothetical protein
MKLLESNEKKENFISNLGNLGLDGRCGDTMKNLDEALSFIDDESAKKRIEAATYLYRIIEDGSIIEALENEILMDIHIILYEDESLIPNYIKAIDFFKDQMRCQDVLYTIAQDAKPDIASMALTRLSKTPHQLGLLTKYASHEIAQRAMDFIEAMNDADSKKLAVERAVYEPRYADISARALSIWEEENKIQSSSKPYYPFEPKHIENCNSGPTYIRKPLERIIRKALNKK